MIVLGIHEDTNANVALLQDGKILFAVAEERLTRKKFQGGYPARGLALIERLFGITVGNADAVVAGNPHHFLSRIPGARPDGEHDFFGPLHKGWLKFQDVLGSSKVLKRATAAVSDAALSARIRRRPVFVDHHTAHAYGAFMTSGMSEAVAISADNMGDGFASKVFDCTGGRCRELYGSTALRSPGQFYGEITQLVGFHCLMAGKVTGLAAYADWRPAYPLMSRLFSLSRDGSDFAVYPLWRRRRRSGVFREIASFSPAEIAAAAQRRFEDVMVGYVRHALRLTGRRKVVVAGGIFGNVKLNQRIMELEEVDELFVHPAMSDQGIAVGAALQFVATNSGLLPRRLEHVFLGPSWSREDMAEALDEAKLEYGTPSDLEAEVARLLVEGNVVARFDGALEYGPRALGHRTIMYRPDDPAVNDWLNRRLARSEFMPFAPATLSEYADSCYVNVARGRYSAEFMTVSFHCTDAMKKSCPGVVHIDGTARPQLVKSSADPAYHRIISLFHEKTGLPSVINTSFNMHGEPIVASPKDAVQAFLKGGLDAMAMGPFLVFALQDKGRKRGQ